MGDGVGPEPNTNTSYDRQADVDIATGGIGIRADVVGFLHQILGLLLLHPRQRDAQRDIQTAGVILMVVGVIALVISLMEQLIWADRRRSRVVEEPVAAPREYR